MKKMKMMINYPRIVSALFFALVFTVLSCSKDTVNESPQNPLPGNSSQLIKVSGEGAAEATKTTLNGLVTSWVAGTDKVGIYSPQARTAAGGGGTAVVNAEFTAASSGVSSNFNGTMYWGAASTSHTFYAYYPYAAGSPASSVVPVSLASAQTQASANNTDHIGALAFLVATPVTVTSPNNTNAVANEVKFRYNHLFTILEFQIKGTGTLKAVKLQGNSNLAFSGGTIDITQATPESGIAYTLAGLTGTTKETVVTLTSAATLTATNTDTKVYMVINPGTPTGSCLVGVSTDGTTWKYLEKAVPSAGFKRGTKYVVTIDAAEATLENVVVGAAGRIWKDRNLGASRVAISYDDADAYGDLYQWGRLTDGHEKRNSGTTSILATSDTPGHGDFILSTNDWRNPQKATLWQGISGVNNPCPPGFRLPNDTEWNNEISAWPNGGRMGSFFGPLKLTSAGNRNYQNGSINLTENTGHYWSSNVTGNDSRFFYFSSNNASGDYLPRAFGLSVRCIKD